MASLNVVPDIEIENVKDVYNNIAEKFSNTRYKAWNSTEKFIEKLEKNTKVLEVGCGNGKNLDLRNDIEFYGCDISTKLLDICREKKLNVKECDGCDLDYEDNYFDSVFSVAVIHHLSTMERRIKFLEEMCRVVKRGGNIFFQVWSIDEPKYHKSKEINKYDRFVLFNYDDCVYERYYHFFDLDEMTLMINTFNETSNYKLFGNIREEFNNIIFEGIVK
jgi:ubiquinone/menaquinone biosynthesis C-methylase UbiE